MGVVETGRVFKAETEQPSEGDVRDPDAAVSTYKSFVVEDGHPGVVGA